MRPHLLPFVAALTCATAPSRALTANPLETSPAGGWGAGVTGGAGGAADTAHTTAEFVQLLKIKGPHIIYVSGKMEGTFYLKTGNKSILGLPGAEIVGSFTVHGSSPDSIVRNVIVRNLRVHPAGTCQGDSGEGSCETFGDNFTIKYVRRAWFDHLTVHDGLDGNLDITHGCDSITLSWIRQYYTRTGIAHQFSNLIGHSDKNGVEDSTRLRITWHHSLWGDGIRERMPRVRFGRIHLYNNVFASSAANYCIRVGYQANVLAEGNAFLGTHNPYDLYSAKAIYPAGTILLRRNLFRNTDGDTVGNGTGFTPPYAYTLAEPATLDGLVTPAATGAGANLTWGPPVSTTRRETPADLRLERRGGSVVATNAGAERQILSVWTTGGRRLARDIALEPGSSLELPSATGLRVVRSISSAGARTFLAPR